MTIDEYLEAEGLTVAEFALLIGVHRTAAYRYRDGERLPDPLVIRRIRDVTGRAVGADDIYDAFEAKHGCRRAA